jgi:putative ABC transport system substrate-binding protein
MRRREFISLLGASAAAWPFAARGQQLERMRRIGVLMAFAEDHPEAKVRLAGLRQGLVKRGWFEGRNFHIDYRFAPDSSTDQTRLIAKELIALRPELIFAHSTPVIAALQNESREIPIVFAGIADPIGSGFIKSLPQPGGHITGVMQYESSVTGKWLAMLKEIAPQLTRVAFVASPKTAPYYRYYLDAGELLAQSLGIELVPTLFEEATEIERAIESFSHMPNGGLLLPPDVATTGHRDLITALAAPKCECRCVSSMSVN